MSVGFSTMSYSNPYRQTTLKPKTEFKSNYMQQNTNKQNVGFGMSLLQDECGNPRVAEWGIVGLALTAILCNALGVFDSENEKRGNSTPASTEQVLSQNLMSSEQNAIANLEKEAGGKIIIPEAKTTLKNTTNAAIKACFEAGGDALMKNGVIKCVPR